MSSIFSRVHVLLRRALLAMAVTSAVIPAGALAASSSDTAAGAAPRTVAHQAGPAAPPGAPADPAVDLPAPPAAGAAPHAAARAGGPSAPAARIDRSPQRVSRTRSAAPEGAPAPPPEATPVADTPPPAEAPAQVIFATVAGQPLALPEQVHGVGFHESGDPRALALDPVGTATTNLNASRVTLPAPSGPTEYMVLGSRGRANGATSAVDISVGHGVAVRAPVSGTVENVSTYQLYGRTPDELVEIIPDGRPDLRVRLLHVEGVTVAPGDRVEAGITDVAATARLLPFRSQIDRYAGRHPHLHIEVHPRDPAADDADAPAPEG